jgi:hypothetical protein
MDSELMTTVPEAGNADESTSPIDTAPAGESDRENNHQSD